MNNSSIYIPPLPVNTSAPMVMAPIPFPFNQLMDVAAVSGAGLRQTMVTYDEDGQAVASSTISSYTYGPHSSLTVDRFDEERHRQRVQDLVLLIVMYTPLLLLLLWLLLLRSLRCSGCINRQQAAELAEEGECLRSVLRLHRNTVTTNVEDDGVGVVRTTTPMNSRLNTRLKRCETNL